MIKFPAKSSKYKAKKVQIDGYVFDSIAESERYLQLRLMIKAGEISDLQIHPVYELIPSVKAKTMSGQVTNRKATYEADFSYISDGQLIVEDVKGFMTEAFKIKKKLFQWRYPTIVLRLTKVRFSKRAGYRFVDAQ